MRSLRVGASAVLVLALASVVLSGLPPLPAAASTPPAGSVAATDASPARAEVGSTLHVDCSRSGEGDGTRSAPYSRVASVSGVRLLPGTAVLFKRGASCTGSLLVTSSGTASAPIVIGSYGSSGRAVLHGGGTGDRSATVELVDVHDVVLRDLTVTNRDSRREVHQYRSGVLIRNSGHRRLPGIVVERLLVEHVVSNLSFDHGDAREWGGISALTSRGSGGFDRLRISGNTVWGVGRTGIIVANRGYPLGVDSHLRVDGNRVTRARGDSIVVRGSVDARIDHNVSAYGGGLFPCSQCGRVSPLTANAGIWSARSKGVLIDQNEVYGERRYGGDGEGLDVDSYSRDVVVERNYSHDNEGGGVLVVGASNTTIRFNVFENNGKAALTFIGSKPASRTLFHNNTIHAEGWTKAKLVRTFNGRFGDDVHFFNNVVLSWAIGTYEWPSRPRSSNNVFVGRHGAGEPAGRRVRDATVLRAPGRGAVGFSTLHGYESATLKGLAGAPIDPAVRTDFFGRRIDPRRPPLGAAR